MILLYIALVAAANIITASTAPLDVGGYIVPWGTFLIAMTFFMRDAVQLERGKQAAYSAIGLGLIVALLTSYVMDDTLAVVAGSAVAFAASESLDTEVFSRLHAGLAERVWWSGAVGGLVDSILFAVIAFSPLWSGFVAWGDLWRVILPLWLVKVALNGAAAFGVRVALDGPRR